MLKFVVVDTPKSVPKCSKCGEKVEWFGMFSNHDIQNEFANGYCTKCGHFNTIEKDLVYGTVNEIGLTALKKLLGKKSEN